MTEALPVPAPTKATPAGAGRKVLFSAMKNEAPFVLEWIAYHKVIGFDEVVICSNPSNDGMEEILAALAEAGEMRHLRATVPEGKSPQIFAIRKFAADVGFHNGDWYLWLDGDEFLNVHVGDRTVSALVEELGERHCALINWRIFGSSGHARFPGRFVSPDFARASRPDFLMNTRIKGIFRHSAAFSGFAEFGIHRPLIARNSGLRLEDFVTGNGQPALPTGRSHLRWLTGEDFTNTSQLNRNESGWALAQINHYIVRTKDFFGLKQKRGRGYVSRNNARKVRHTDEFFREHDRNEAEDRSILHWQDRVTAEIDRLMQIPDVAAAVASSQALVEGHLAQLAAPVAAAMADAPDGGNAFAMAFPAAERGLLESCYARASNVLEYGGGASTVLAARSGLSVICVEGDKNRANRLAAHLSGITDKARVHPVDIGPTGEDGRPLKPRAHQRFHRYALSVWDRPDLAEPDLVLIAGRFRAACLAAVKLRATRPTTVLFADYADRTHYHGVERLAVKEEVAGHMARFTVTPGPIPPEMMTEVVGWFSDPR
ncbi:glycosyltransferase family 2 protein [Tabrizicola sp.]|uniref:glycosyltransferase family 2 protein n=1 Tax=Tabrizicola sp. TaxID=2005166 RepID=UPI002636FE97|nr:glycosyltransferase family 2 protein [Tabrizicola sp.]MDM7930713.1 glycosyltransferase family 2 protein [Tabrizicola sp.]